MKEHYSHPMVQPEYLHLQRTEIGVLDASAAIFAAKVQNGSVNSENEQDIINESVLQAIKLARKVDESVRSEGEMG